MYLKAKSATQATTTFETSIPLLFAANWKRELRNWNVQLKKSENEELKWIEPSDSAIVIAESLNRSRKSFISKSFSTSLLPLPPTDSISCVVLQIIQFNGGKIKSRYKNGNDMGPICCIFPVQVTRFSQILIFL